MTSIVRAQSLPIVGLSIGGLEQNPTDDCLGRVRKTLLLYGAVCAPDEPEIGQGHPVHADDTGRLLSARGLFVHQETAEVLQGEAPSHMLHAKREVDVFKVKERDLGRNGNDLPGEIEAAGVGWPVAESGIVVLRVRVERREVFAFLVSNWLCHVAAVTSDGGAKEMAVGLQRLSQSR